jgi:ketosteroid isomerase-like protein
VRSTFHLLVEIDSAAILEWTSECRSAAGADASYDGVSVAVTRDGRIARFTAYSDPADLLVEQR